jgi:hypothetical protein
MVNQTDHGQDAYIRVRNLHLSNAEAFGMFLHAVGAVSNEQTCNQLNAMDPANPRRCSDAAGSVLGNALSPSAAHDYFPGSEELLPERYF